MAQKINFDGLSSEELARYLIDNKDHLEAVEDINQLVDLKKKLNLAEAAGAAKSKKQKFANLSIINTKETDTANFMVTAFVGYLYRLVAEYEPEECEDKTVVKAARETITKFLDRHLRFNPDRHVRESHSENREDPTRKTKEQLVKVIEEARQLLPPSLSQESLKEQSQILYQCSSSVVSRIKSVRDILSQLIERDDLPEPLREELMDTHAFLSADAKKIEELVQKVGSKVKPSSIAEVAPAAEVDPPVDLFYHFKRYCDAHFEELKDIAGSLYNTKSDIENLVILYDTFDNEKDAITHRRVHRAEFKHDVFTISNSGIVLLGPFKKNRESIDLYTKQTQILYRMKEEMEKNEEIAKDIIKKKVVKAEKKKIEELGDDTPGLEEYKKVMHDLSNLTKYGAEPAITKEERMKISREMKKKAEEARRIKEQLEVPDKCVQVNVFYDETNEDGERVMKRGIMYTEEDKPNETVVKGNGEIEYEGHAKIPLEDNIL